MRSFVLMSTTNEDLFKQGKVPKRYAERYRICRADYPGDFEMANACVENLEIMDRHTSGL